MYYDKEAPKPTVKWVDPTRQAEMQERDRIRQEYYARLEQEKSKPVNKRKKSKE